MKYRLNRTLVTTVLALVMFSILGLSRASAGNWVTTITAAGKAGLLDSNGGVISSTPIATAGYENTWWPTTPWWALPSVELAAYINVNVTLTWVPDPGDDGVDVGPPPHFVHVLESSDVYVGCGFANPYGSCSSMADDGFGDFFYQGKIAQGTYSAESEGSHLSFMQTSTDANGNTTVTFQRTLVADLKLSGMDGGYYNPEIDLRTNYTANAVDATISSDIEQSWYKGFNQGSQTYYSAPDIRYNSGFMIVDTAVSWSTVSNAWVLGTLTQQGNVIECQGQPYIGSQTAFVDPLFRWDVNTSGTILPSSDNGLANQTPWADWHSPTGPDGTDIASVAIQFPYTPKQQILDQQVNLRVHVKDGDGLIQGQLASLYRVLVHLPYENWKAVNTTQESDGPLYFSVDDPGYAYCGGGITCHWDWDSVRWSWAADFASAIFTELTDADLGNPVYSALFDVLALASSNLKPTPGSGVANFNDNWGDWGNTSDTNHIYPPPTDDTTATMRLYRMKPRLEIGYDLIHTQGDGYGHNGYTGPTTVLFKEANGQVFWRGDFSLNPTGGGGGGFGPGGPGGGSPGVGSGPGGGFPNGPGC